MVLVAVIVAVREVDEVRLVKIRGLLDRDRLRGNVSQDERTRKVRDSPCTGSQQPW